MVDILDHRGNKLQKAALKTPQTAKIAQLHQEFANHPTRGLTPQRLARILEDAERGDLTAQCDLFEDMEEKDGHMMAELGKRKRALLGLGWDIQPPRNASAQEEKIAGQVQDLILDIPNFEDVILDLADAIGYGYSCLEYEWMRRQYWQPAAIRHRPPRWFQPDREQRNELRLRDNTANGVEMWPAGWIVHIHKAKSGDLARTGLHRSLAWPFIFKNYSVRDLAEFLEIYGLPVRLGQYPPGASDKEKNTLLQAVVNMGHAAAGIIPEGMLVEFKEAAKGGSDPYQAMMDWCERTQSKVILGGTLTSQADGKSSTNALGNVHNEVRKDLLIADARQIAGTLSRDLVMTLCRLNGWLNDPLRCPRFAFDTMEPEDLSLYAEALPKLVDIGFPVPVSYVQSKLRIPEPENNEPILARGSVAHDATEKQALAALKTESGQTFPDQNALDQVLDALSAGQLQQQMEVILKPILNLAETAPDQVLGKLAEKYPKMNDEQLQEQLARLIFVADTWGRLNGISN